MFTAASTVFIVDPDATHRHTLTVSMRRAGLRAEAFPSTREFLARPRCGTPSCLVLDLGFQGSEALEVQYRLSRERKETPVIVMSSHVDLALLVRSMKAGAVDVIMKPVAEHILLAAVGEAISRSRAVLQQDGDLLELRQRHDSLSVREREVMAKVVAGLLNKQVGAALAISVVTVKAHRGRVMRKMRATSLAELVAMSLRLDLPLGSHVAAPALPSRVPLAELPRRHVSNNFSSAAR